MIFFAFAIFFALNFSLWYMLPSFLLKSLTKTTKRKDKEIRNDYVIYFALTGIYILIYTMFHRYFSFAIEDLGDVDGIGYFVNNLHNISTMAILFAIISIIHSAYTFYVAKRSFKFEHVKYAYVIVSITGLLNVVTYFINNSILNLASYAFLAEHALLNFVLKIDTEFIIFIFPMIVFSNFALSFIEEK